MLNYNRVENDGNEGKLVKKLLKIEKLQKPKKFTKIMSLKKSSFLIFKIRLAFIKITLN